MPQVSQPGTALAVLRFGLTGLLNTAVGLVTVIAARELAGLSEYAANAAGYAVGLAFGFAMNRSWTFADRRRVAITGPRYALAFVLSYAANLLVLTTCLYGLALPSNLAQAFSLLTYSAVFFLLCRRFVFSPPSA